MNYKPDLQEQVLVKCQPASDAAQGIIGKFQRPYEGPYLIYRQVNPSIYELVDSQGKKRGIFNIKHLKPYLEEPQETVICKLKKGLNVNCRCEE
jgi:hypothetical protein